MDFRLPQGPWEPIFAGVILGYEVEVLSNASSNLLSAIYEVQDGKKVSAVLEMYKPLFVRGETESFVETLPRKITLLISHSKQETLKFMIVDSEPSYVTYEQEAMSREVERLLENTERFTGVVKEVSKAYDIEIKEITEVDERRQQSFYGMPIVSLLVTPKLSAHAEHGAMTESLPIGEGEIILGITRKGQAVKEPLSFFSRTVITGGSDSDRLKAIHVMAESSILSGIPAIILDFSGSFSRMNYPNKESTALSEFGLNFEPIGLPFAQTSADKIRIDMRRVNAKGLLELFEVSDPTVVRLIASAFDNKAMLALKEAEHFIITYPLSEEINEYKKSKALRILRLIDSRYAGMFRASPDVNELMKGWLKGLGKAYVLRFSPEDRRLNSLLLESLTAGIYTEFMTSETPRRAFLFIEKGEQFLRQEGASASSNASASNIIRSSDKGLYFAVDAYDSANLSEKIKMSANARISVIAENDIGVQLKGKQSFRAILRPGITEFVQPLEATGPSLQALNQHNP